MQGPFLQRLRAPRLLSMRAPASTQLYTYCCAKTAKGVGSPSAHSAMMPTATCFRVLCGCQSYSSVSACCTSRLSAPACLPCLPALPPYPSLAGSLNTPPSCSDSRPPPLGPRPLLAHSSLKLRPASRALSPHGSTAPSSSTEGQSTRVGTHLIGQE